MERNDALTAGQRIEGVVVFLLSGLSYFVVVAPLLGDIHPTFALPAGEGVGNHLLDTPRDWLAIPYLVLTIWAYTKIRERLVGPIRDSRA
ncbi:hypothetical protein [Haladaptatus sp. DFWS20]|uniref:hypothetical protein n=1 Tax=Haladaptatus sp. DFWS20 TaxID=3403467 RepID=UPI003EBDC5BC